MGFFTKDDPTQPSRPEVVSLYDLMTKGLMGYKTAVDVAKDGAVSIALDRIQKKPVEPTRAESLAVAHQFYEAASFAAYVARYGIKSECTVYADPQSEQMWAVLDESAPSGYETVTLKPQISPLWAPWAALVARGAVELNEFREFLNENRRAVTTPPGRSLALMLAQVRGAVEVTIHDGRGKDALNGIMVKSSVQGTDTKEYVAIPEELILRVPLYVGEDPREIHLDLVVDAGPHGGVTVQVAAGGIQEARVLAFDAMLAKIRVALVDVDALVGYGQPRHVDWRYLAPERA